MPLEKAVAQDSFSAGMFRGVARHLIPPNGCYDLLNFLLDDEDGTPYKRDGAAYLTPTSAFRPNGGVGIWDGRTVAGDRTLLAGMQSATEGRLAIAAADDLSLTYNGALGIIGPNVKFTENDGVVIVTGNEPVQAGSAAGMLVYAGSRKTAEYTTGTVSMTASSKVVTGAGTAWSANVDQGMVIEVAGRFNIVESVDSNTQITLRYAYGGPTAAGLAYTLRPVGSIGAAANEISACAEFVAGRPVGVPYNNPTRMVFNAFLPDTADPDYGGYNPTNYHQFPGRVIGINAIRDTAFVFTTAGLFAVSNMTFDLTDDMGNAQQRVEKLDGMVLWSHQGVAAWGNALIVPARDGVYLVDGVSAPTLLSRSMDGLYRAYVNSGYRPGQGTVYRNTYLLPILDSSLAVQGWFTCKLDGGDSESGFWPWTRLTSTGVRAAAVRNRIDSAPRLLGVSSATGARLCELWWFDEGSGVQTEVDESAITFQLETRDYPTGSGNRNTVRKARVAYNLKDSPPNTAAISFSYASEDGSYTQHTDTAAAAEPGSETWLFVERGRYVRFKLACSSVSHEASIKSIEAWVRPNAKD